MSEPTIVAAPDKLHTPFLNSDGSITYHLVAAFSIAGIEATPVFWPKPSRGAKEITEQPGVYMLDGMRADSLGKLVQLVRERVQ